MGMVRKGFSIEIVKHCAEVGWIDKFEIGYNLKLSSKECAKGLLGYGRVRCWPFYHTYPTLTYTSILIPCHTLPHIYPYQ